MTVEGNQPLSAKGPTTKAESTGKNLFKEKETTHFSPITNSPTPFLGVEEAIRVLRVNRCERKMCSPWCSRSQVQNLWPVLVTFTLDKSLREDVRFQ